MIIVCYNSFRTQTLNTRLIRTGDDCEIPHPATHWFYIPLSLRDSVRDGPTHHRALDGIPRDLPDGHRRSGFARLCVGRQRTVEHGGADGARL